MQSKFNIKSIYEIVKFNAIGALYRIIKLNFFCPTPKRIRSPNHLCHLFAYPLQLNKSHFLQRNEVH